MSARIFVHPRCQEGPAVGALSVHLESLGYDVTHIGVGPPDKRGRCELVRTIAPGLYGGLILERMDGTRYTHHAGWPAPEAA